MIAVLLVWTVLLMAIAPRHARSQGDVSLHTDGNRILDSEGNRVVVTGISWFGLETENYAPHGLWARSLDSFLDQILELGFNTIRIPYSNQLFDPGSVPNGINYDLNPDLKGLNGLEIMDRIVADAGERGLKVILDRHRPDSHAQSELWYTPQYSEERWIEDWVMLAKRYAQDDTVIGVDLHNEPRGSATWGSGDVETDWRLAAERAGNAILEANPNLLIVVQGVEQYNGDFYWWGGNLMGVRDYPVRLELPDRVVYSPHTYGPGVYPQPWFSDPGFPDNMIEIWDSHWGYIQKEGLAPVIVGEFGGRSVKDDREGIWQRALVSYLHENEIGYLYWSLNPNSGDTGGILLDDWETVDPDKEALLSSYQFPLIDSGRGTVQDNATASPVSEASVTSIVASATVAASPTISATALIPTSPAAPPTSLPVDSVGLRVRYHTSNTADVSNDAKPEFIVANDGSATIRLEDLEIIYWFKDDPGESYVFNCDWAQIGCENVKGAFEALPDGIYAMRVSFLSGAGQILPAQDSGEIKLRFNRADWSEFRQSDDYSFSTPSDYQDWDRVTLYLNGQLVWGSEPGSVTSTSATGGPAPVGTASNVSEATRPASLGTPSSVSTSPAWKTWGIAALAALLGFLVALLWLGRKRNP
jgi:endoglucanase